MSPKPTPPTLLGQVANFINGGAWAQSEYTDCGIPVVRVTNIKDGEIKLLDCKFLPTFALQKYHKHILRRGDLIIATVGSHPSQPDSVVGRPAIARPNVDGALLNQNAVIIRTSTIVLDQNWLSWFGRTPAFRQYVVSCARGSANQVRMSIGLLKEMPIHIPPLETQKRVGSILSAYDDLIEVNQRRIAILEEMARRLFDEWFVRFRYPGHETVPLVETELGLHPTGWKVKPLGDLVETQYGYTTSASAKDRGPKFLRGMDINKNSYIEWDSVPYCQEQPADASRFSLQMYDILIIRMADPGKVAIVESEVDAIFASYLVRLSANYDILTPYFLFYTLCGQNYQNYVLGAANGATRKSIPASLMVSFQLAIPPRRILKAFESVVAPIRKQAIALVQANSKLRAARDLLLPKLISGEIDVTGTERDLAEAAE